MDDLASLKDFLGRTPFFGGVLDEALEYLATLLIVRDVAAQTPVFVEGEHGRSMFILRSGEVVALHQASAAGPAVKLMRFRQGDFFGETTLIEMQPRPFTAVAEQPARLYELTSRHLYDLYKRDVHTYVMVLQNINRELCRRLRRANDRVSHFATEMADEETQIPDEWSGRL
ncbi:MAG: Crp/Fnr family transcriptional regulator [Polyangiaceae bacterium]